MLLCRMVLLMNTPDDRNDAIPEDVQAYIADTLHVPLALTAWAEAAQLPPYLRSGYRYYEGAVHGAPVLWMFVSGANATPAVLSKHLAALLPYWPGPVALVFRELPSYARHRLIQRGIAFVVPGTQLYLPDLAIDFRTRARAARRQHGVVLRPSAQVLLLHLLQAQASEPLTAAEAAPLLGYSKMTMTRAVDELEQARLVEVTRTGRRNVLHLAGERREVWDAAKERLLNPVTRVVRTAVELPAAPLAGVSALAQTTMIAAPAITKRAVGPAEGKTLRMEPRVTAYPLEADHGAGEQDIEIWSYDPRALSDGPAVDPLSLFLSLRDDDDERVQSALAEMLEDVAW